MGYITRHELTVKKLSDVPAFLGEINKSNEDLLEKDVIAKLLEDCEDARYALNSDGGSEEPCKWYESTKDLVDFSKKYPGYLFILNGEGEEAGDIWRLYCVNGKHELVKAKVAFDDPNWSNLG